MKVLVLIVFIFCSHILHTTPFQVFSENGKMGIRNGQGQVVVPPSFDALGWSDGSFSVAGNVTGYRINNQWGILSLQNKFITKADYESLVYAGADNIVARKKINPAYSKTGLINLKGEIKIPFQYQGIVVHGLRAIVFNIVGAKYVHGLTDLENNVLVPVQFKSIYPLGTLRFAVENENGKIALYGEDGKPITDFQIDSVSQFRDSKAVVYENLRQGLIDRDGVVKLKTQYRSIQITGDNKVRVQLPHEWLFINEKNESVTSFHADELIPAHGNFFIIKISGKYGLITRDLKPAYAVRYDILSSISPDLFLARLAGKAGVIDSRNTEVIPFVYDSLLASGNNFRAFKKTEGWQLVDGNNKPLTQKNYDWIGPIKNNLYPAEDNHYQGALNETGEEIIHCVFDSLVEISDDLLVVKFKNQFGIINTREDWVVAPQAHPLHLINNQLYAQQQPLNLFLKNFTGDIIYFTDNRVAFKKDFFLEYLPDGTEKTIDYIGRIINRTEPPKLKNLEQIFQVSEGLRGIQRDGKFGFVDERGRLRVANRYDAIGEFHEGVAPVKLIGKWGFVNSTDQVVINPNYEKVGAFIDGIALATRNGKAGVIDKKGNTVLGFQYDSVQYSTKKKFLLYNNGLVGLADVNGTVLIDPRFDHLSQLDNGLVLVDVQGKFGVITTLGHSVIPIVYDALTFDKIQNQFLALRKSEWREVEVK